MWVLSCLCSHRSGSLAAHRLLLRTGPFPLGRYEIKWLYQEVFYVGSQKRATKDLEAQKPFHKGLLQSPQACPCAETLSQTSVASSSQGGTDVRMFGPTIPTICHRFGGSKAPSCRRKVLRNRCLAEDCRVCQQVHNFSTHACQLPTLS